MAKSAPASPEVVAQLRRLALQYLVHCFLYYRLDEPILGDEQFDQVAHELRKLRQAHSAAEMPHAKVIDPVLGPEVSGFQIRGYPEPVIAAAFKLLYNSGKKQVDFVEFVERFGYRAHVGGTGA